MSININHNTNRIGINSTDWISGNTVFNVGIGTTNPTSKLHIVGNTLVSGVVTATSFYGDGSSLTGVSAGVNYWSSTAAGINTTSNVGIGTTVPTSKLHVVGDVLVSGTGIVTATKYYGDGTSLTGATVIYYCGDNNFISCNSTFPNLTTGNHNISIGRLSGNSLTSGCFNTFFGISAGRGNTSGQHNIFIGNSAGKYNTSGSRNLFFGCYAGFYNTTGFSNNYFGASSGRCGNGTNNNFFGDGTGLYLTTGSHNNFFGNAAGCCNTSGYNNNFFGNSSGRCNTTGCDNNFFGASTGSSNTTGCNNIFLGRYSGTCNTSGNFNTYVGSCSGTKNTGSCNTFFGTCSGCNQTSGNNNVVIGNNIQVPIITGSDQLAIGNGASAWIYGNSAYNVGIGTTNPTSKLHVVGDVLISGTGIVTATSTDVTGITRIKNFTETQSSSSISSNILNIDATQGTVFTHTTSSQIGIVSFTGISTARANVQTFTVLITQGATPTNITNATGIGTQLATIVTDGGVGINTHIKVGSGTTITLTNSVGALDVLTFIVSYNGVGIASTNFTLIGVAATNFRGVI